MSEIPLPPKLYGSFTYHDDGKMLHHKESNTYYIIATGYDGIPFWTPSPISHAHLDAFSRLGVSEHGEATGPIPNQSFHIE